jgi:hypothetical protein
MEELKVGTTRVRHEHSQDIQGEIIRALKNNIGDFFTSAEIADTIGRMDVQSQHVASVLKVMVRDGLVEQSREPGGNLYSLTKKALAWKRAPYNWRVSKGISQTVAQSVVPPVTQDTDMFVPVPPPPGIAALSIDQPPLNTVGAVMPPLLVTPPLSDADLKLLLAEAEEALLPEATPVEPKKVCRCARVAKLPPLPDGYDYTGIKLLIGDEGHSTALTVQTILADYLNEGSEVLLQWVLNDRFMTNRGGMAKLAAIGDALIDLHTESNRHE